MSPVTDRRPYPYDNINNRPVTRMTWHDRNRIAIATRRLTDLFPGPLAPIADHLADELNWAADEGAALGITGRTWRLVEAIENAEPSHVTPR